jgi:Terpene synthase family 2, C-terminal metal binding
LSTGPREEMGDRGNGTPQLEQLSSSPLKYRERVVLPRLATPLPVESNPFEDRVRPSEERLAALGVQVSSEIMILRSASLMHPRVGMDDLRLVADIFGFFFAYDDQFDGPLGWDEAGTAQTVDATKRIFAGHVPDQVRDPLNHTLMRLWEQLRLRASTELWERIVSHTLGWLDGYRWETGLRVQQRIPDVAEQTRERFWTSEMSFDWEYVELTDAPFLPRAFIRHPDIQQALTDFTLIVAWSNDIISMSRENPYNNIVYALQQERTCPLQDAIDSAYKLVLKLCDDVLDRRSRLPGLARDLRLDPFETARVQRWYTSMLLSAGGAVRWHLESGRYSQEPHQDLPSAWGDPAADGHQART